MYFFFFQSKGCKKLVPTEPGNGKQSTSEVMVEWGGPFLKESFTLPIAAVPGTLCSPIHSNCAQKKTRIFRGSNSTF